MSIIVLGEEDLVDLFNTLGIDGIVTNDPDSMLANIRKNRKEKKYEVIMISGKLASKCRKEINEIEFEKKGPLVIEIPNHVGEDSELKLNLMKF